jgi:hypothetical protein
MEIVGTLFGCLPGVLAAAVVDAPVELELHRIDLDPAAAAGGAGAAPAGEACVLVLRLPRGRQLVSARLDIDDGFVRVPARRWARLSHVARALALEAATERAPLLGSALRMLVAGGARGAPTTNTEVAVSPLVRAPSERLVRRVVLRRGDFAQHEGYAAAVVLLAAGPLARIELSRIVTRSIGRGGQRRERATSVGVPESTQPGLAPARAKELLTGRGGEGWRRRAPR